MNISPVILLTLEVVLLAGLVVMLVQSLRDLKNVLTLMVERLRSIEVMVILLRDEVLGRDDNEKP